MTFKKKVVSFETTFFNVEGQSYFFFEPFFLSFLALWVLCLITAWAAANLAIGTLKGEQLT